MQNQLNTPHRIGSNTNLSPSVEAFLLASVRIILFSSSTWRSFLFGKRCMRYLNTTDSNDLASKPCIQIYWCAWKRQPSYLSHTSPTTQPIAPTSNKCINLRIIEIFHSQRALIWYTHTRSGSSNNFKTCSRALWFFEALKIQEMTILENLDANFWLHAWRPCMSFKLRFFFLFKFFEEFYKRIWCWEPCFVIFILAFALEFIVGPIFARHWNIYIRAEPSSHLIWC